MISRMLQGVEVKTDVDFCQHRNYWIEQTNAVLYTGCLDELMDYKLGELEYRALDFQTSCMEIPNYQGMAVINETGTDVAYTRTIEHKHFDYNNNAPFTIDFHLHNHCAAKDWTREFSKYDAAWLHCINSKNGGSLMKATWDDLNIPARISSYAAAGLQVISPSNEGCISAITETLKDYDIGILFDNFDLLIRMLHDRKLLRDKQENMMKNRPKFSFDYYVPEMTGLFRQAIEEKGGHNE